MIHDLARAALVLMLFGAPSVAIAEGCVSTTPPAQQNTDKGPPATVGNDGVGATGWTGGTGGLMAGIENEKRGQKPEPDNPNVAKGIDPTKGVSNDTGGPGQSKGPTSGPKPNC